MESSSPNFSSDCRGHGLIEFLVVVQLLAFIGLVGVDLAMALERYLTINNIAYEGSRLGSITPGEETVAPTVEGRVNLLLSLELPKLIKAELIEEGDEKSAPAPGTETGGGSEDKVERFSVVVNTSELGDGGNKTLQVRVNADYQPMFPFINKLSLSATVTAPYLARGSI